MRILALFTALLCGSALAQTPDADMARCAAIPDATPRLACLDALAAAAVARLQPGVQAAVQEKNFGAAAPKPVVEAPEQIRSEIEGLVEGWRQGQLFRLKNGQAWRVVDAGGGDIGLRNPKVRVSRNRFGTYFLEFEGRNDAIKVRRAE